MLKTNIDPLRSPHTVIIGAGHAGGSAAAFLRQNGFAGSITLIGEEPLEPYQRPPLSKAWLKGEADEDGLRLRPRAFYLENHIQICLNQRVDAIVARHVWYVWRMAKQWNTTVSSWPLGPEPAPRRSKERR